MNTELITVGPFEVNCAVVWKEERKALVIDPGYDAPLIQSYLDAHGLTVEAYLLTHGHADHINALNEMHAAHPAPVYLHPADQEWAFGPNNQIPPCYPVPAKPETEIFNPTNPPRPSASAETSADTPGILSQNGNRKKLRLNAVVSNVWKIAGLSFQTLETPGHTPGGVCYWFKDAGVCFVGDTLFKGSCGRTDLPGGDARTLTASLKKLTETLPPETRIIAGHGEDSTMAHELKTNFFLQRFQS